MKAITVLTLPLEDPANRETSPLELTTLGDGDRVIATEIASGFVTLVVVSRKREAFDGDPEDEGYLG